MKHENVLHAMLLGAVVPETPPNQPMQRTVGLLRCRTQATFIHEHL